LILDVSGNASQLNVSSEREIFRQGVKGTRPAHDV